MDLYEIIQSLSVAFTPQNLLYCLIGSLLGTIVGILPGIGPLTTIAILLPITYALPATGSLIMLAGIYYGSYHAGSTTSIMLNLPGEPASVVICFDGHPMARDGRAGPALCIAAFSSFLAGCLAVLMLAFFSPPLARFALQFGAPENAAMVIFALIATSIFTERSLLNSIGSAVLGLLLGTIGTDVQSSLPRFTFGIPNLLDGLSFVTIAVGLFAFSEIIATLRVQEKTTSGLVKVGRLLPTLSDLRLSWLPTIRGTLLGGAFGVVPGTGPLVSSFVAYNMEQRLSRDPSRFGKGAVEGVAGPEAAQNAAAITHFIPMMTLGIPAGAAMALLLGAMNLHGVSPGPSIMTEHKELFWGVVGSMWVGNVMLLILNLPLVGIWIYLLTMPYRFLFPGILAFCCLGQYSIAKAPFDIFAMVVFGLLGYLFHKTECAPAPLLFGFILGPLLEENLRRALMLSQGDASVFVTQPLSLFFLLMAAGLLLVFHTPLLRGLRGRIRRTLDAAG